MRITLVISALTCGGAQRVMANMANYWAEKGWSPTLITLSGASVERFYDLSSAVDYRPLGVATDSANLPAAVWNNLRRILVLRRTIRNSRPDVVISFMETTNVITLLSTRGLGVPVIVSEHTDPALYSISGNWEALRHWTYPTADRLTFVTRKAADYFPSSLQPKIRVMTNPVLIPQEGTAAAGPSLARPAVIAVGRLAPEKGFDLLLEAFARLKDHFPDWRLTILGEGPMRQQLEDLSDCLGLAGRLDLPGAVQDPYSFLRQADLFVLSSRFEGFPCALCEAMACGLAVMATEAGGGTREIVRERVDGVIVPTENVEALTEAMTRLMSDDAERRRLAVRAVQVSKRFATEKVMGAWEAIIHEVVLER